MKQLWAIDPHDGETPPRIKRAIMEHGKYMELHNESHFFIDPGVIDIEEATEAEKTLIEYIKEDLKLDPNDVLFFFWW